MAGLSQHGGGLGSLPDSSAGRWTVSTATALRGLCVCGVAGKVRALIKEVFKLAYFWAHWVFVVA